MKFLSFYLLLKDVLKLTSLDLCLVFQMMLPLVSVLCFILNFDMLGDLQEITGLTKEP